MCRYETMRCVSVFGYALGIFRHSVSASYQAEPWLAIPFTVLVWRLLVALAGRVMCMLWYQRKRLDTLVLSHAYIVGFRLVMFWLVLMVPCQAPALPESMVSRERAQRLLAEGVVSEAATVLTYYLREHADDVGARYELARLLVDLDRYTEAVEHALLIPADDRVYSVDRQHLLLRIRMRMASDLDWDDPDAVLAYARLCSRMGSYERSARAYRWLLSDSTTPALLREYAAVLEWGGDLQDAAREWKRYLESHPEDLDAWHRLARTDMALGTLEDAKRVLLNILEREPDRGGVMLDLARVLIWMGDMASAERILADLQEMRYKPVDVGMLRSELLLRLGQVEAGYDNLQNVLAKSPDDPRARQMLQALATSRRVEIARLRRRILESPGEEADRIRLIDILLDVDRPGAALREMKTLALLRPGDAVIRERIAQLEARQQRDVAIMMQRLTKTTGADRNRETLNDWLARHPDDLRAVRHLDRSFRSPDATGMESQP